VKPPEAATGIASAVTRRLSQVLEDERRRWFAVDPDLAAPIESLTAALLAGGKRLRPALCFWAFVGAGGDPEDPSVVGAGAALETLHAAALIHDDVIDGSRRRHGTDATHVRFELHHRSRGWAGHSGRFGEGAAILVGDLALAYADRFLGYAPAKARAVFDEMRLEVNIGQYLDLLGTAEGVDLPNGRAAERASRICRYKTAKYTVERPLHLGIALAAPERLDSLAAPVSAFALPLGEAFQLRDDILGVFGDPAVTGKPVGDDLREGKPTLLASLTIARLDPGSTKLFGELFGSDRLDDSGVTVLQSLIEASGARDDVEREISGMLHASMKALDELPLLAEAKAALGELAAFIAGRDH
jgi:geranylgeranyl diphosphate synthase type I